MKLTNFDLVVNLKSMNTECRRYLDIQPLRDRGLTLKNNRKTYESFTGKIKKQAVVDNRNKFNEISEYQQKYT